MKNFLGLLLALSFMLLAGCGTNGNTGSNPINPLTPTEGQAKAQSGQTQLWGYYDMYLDQDTLAVAAVPNRSVEYSVNIVRLLNKSAANLIISTLQTVVHAPYIDTSVNITIKHPYPGMTQYNAYDVRGIVLTNGHGTMASNAALKYPLPGQDQMLMDNPNVVPPGVAGGGADGYTRWWNPTEFRIPGLFGYTQGMYATKNYAPTATFSPYRYYADGLNASDNAYTWLVANSASRGVFTAGASNTRNFFLRFITGSAAKFAYAVLANWDPLSQPANAPEAISDNVVVTPSIYYVNPTNKGGNLIVDIDVYDWNLHSLVGGVMKDYIITVESTVLNAPHQFTDPEMTPIRQSGRTYTYHLNIPADKITSNTGNQFWVLVKSPSYNYTNLQGIPNLAWLSPITAGFRHDLFVSPVAYTPPVIDSGVSGNAAPQPNSIQQYSVVAHDPDGDPLTYSWTVTDASTMVKLINNDPGLGNGNININWGALGVTDGQQLLVDCNVSDGMFIVPATQLLVIPHWLGWARTWGDAGDDIGYGVAVDSLGNECIAGNFSGTVDLDPGNGIDSHVSNGGTDAYVTKLDPNGNFSWARSWGGTSGDSASDVAVDPSGFVYITGSFFGTIDFDPGAGVDSHTSNTGSDAFISKFDSAGNFVWARTWGGTGGAGGKRIAVDAAGAVCVAGSFGGTADFDPGAGVDSHISVGGLDAYVSMFDTSGNFIWARTWGGTAFMYDGDVSNGVALDTTGNVYVAGYYQNTVDFDPGAGVDNHISNGQEDMFLVKYDGTGNYVWGKTWGGGSVQTDWATDVAVDSSGRVYVGGLFGEVSPQITDFDPGAGVDNHSSIGFIDCSLSQFDTAGNFVWARTWGGPYNDFAYGVAVDSAGEAYITGYFFSTAIDFDPGPGDATVNNNGSYDGYVSKFDAAGNFVWVRTIGDLGFDYAQDVAVDSTGTSFVTGMFNGTVDFNPGALVDAHTSNGGNDAYVVKYPPNGNW
jgi:hypothetical protein